MSSTPTADSRTYRGRTVEELIPRIQEELGSDAIIVRRREGLTGGIAGFFQRPFIELEATAGGPRLDVYDEQDVSPPVSLPIERPAEREPHVQHEREPHVQHEQPPVRAPFYTREPPRVRLDGSYVSEQLAALARAGPLQPTPTPTAPPLVPAGYEPRFPRAGTAHLHDPFAVVLGQATAAPVPAAASVDDTSPRATPARGRTHANIQRRLTELGVSEQFAEELIGGAAAHILPLMPGSGLLQAVQSGLVQRIPVAPPLPARGGAIAIVGPGGAGKTSCCAALLGAYRKSSGLNASCATLVRGSTRGELQMLLSPHVMKLLPIENARVMRALRKTRSEGLLVIDTPALSPGDRTGLRKLAGLLGELGPERIVIALPATLSAVAAAQLLQALRPLGANALALTHADETDQIGVAIEAACRFGLGPEYMLKRGRSGGWRVNRIDPTGLAAKLSQ